MSKYDDIKDTLEKRLDELEHSMENDEEFETTELSNYDNHPADNATDLTDKHTRLALRKHSEDEINDIKEALTAIKEGTYGVCSVCSKEIPMERLEAVPTATTCVEHAQQEVDESIRPVEESILNSSTDQPVDDEDPRIRDYENSFDDLEEVGSSDTPSDKQ
ncbi:TraR/DksA C4-type zinc finger protein [Psychrobacillus vulpis]|uniref:Molecular chaperone DnaK n=1 Tax=Psychrobacillus vulpis TaxID=2325572 RepID=A0A544TVV5_9BACI|nr:TraR/DksA C4-type zinc finger protein [Psychrobacillus vulpis]TQR21566.1 molecular chaperone DnaK [Psychrobacillus vulpis]